jgi:hypothetical protein
MSGQYITVSEMNKVAIDLADRLKRGKPLKWLLFWVSNRRIKVDVDPHPNLLWVGRNNLEKHAPLIGPRGLVRQEDGSAKAKEQRGEWIKVEGKLKGKLKGKTMGNLQGKRRATKK